MTDIELSAARQTAAEELARIDSALAEQAAAKRQECIAQVRELMRTHGLSMSDIGASKPAAKIKAPASNSAMYRNDDGKTWAGRGKRPTWLRDALSAGKALADFKVAA